MNRHPHTPSVSARSACPTLLTGLLVLSLALTACGGQEGSGQRLSKSGGDPSYVGDLNASTLAATAQKALEADEDRASAPLDDLRPGEIAPESAYTSGAIARRALAVRIGAFRFYNRSSGAHFYTVSEAERDNVIARLSPPFSYEGPAFSVASAYSPGLSPVHRFYNSHNGVHFYTISEAERAHVVATLPHYTYEGVAYHASEVAGVGLIPFHRFYVPSKGFHFYTANEQEKQLIQANLGATYRYEGVGYYVLDTGWRAEKLPHTGVETCFQSGADTTVICGVASRALNPDQDGDRRLVNPMQYSQLPNPAGGRFPLSSCVRDEVTGLVWEGKESSGFRSGALLYTNLGNGAASDASGYLNAVNVSRLCGFSDWRLPTPQELLSIAHFGRPAGPFIDTNWFVNRIDDRYWSATALSTTPTEVWFVEMGYWGVWSYHGPGSQANAIRLVRGATNSGQRFTFSTVPYGGDAALNVANDAWTGLQWRRCEQGKVWSGTTCTGIRLPMSHEAALDHAHNQAGWRLPNVRELSSLIDLSVGNGVRINQSAFPGALSDLSHTWSSTPDFLYSGTAKVANFNEGLVTRVARSAPLTVMLVRNRATSE
jgi:Protein of unknown function (DUF1566)/Repeat of unknown function (DUF5648)